MDSISWRERQPMLPLLLPYLAGVGLGAFADSPLPALLLAVAGCGIAAWRLPARSLWLAAALLTFGWFNTARQTHPRRADDLRTLTTGQPELVTLRGRIRTMPEARESEAQGRVYVRTSTELDIDSGLIGWRWQPAHGRVRASTRNTLPDTFFVGRVVEVTGVLRIPNGPAAPGLFDYRRHLALAGIHFILETEDASDWKLADDTAQPHQPPLHHRFQTWGRRTLALGLPALDPYVRLQQAMVLGWRAGLTEELKEPFMRSGTLHVFAISGLHVVLAATILERFLRALQIPRWACALLVGPALWFYAATTGWQPSALRAAVMMSTLLAGQVLHRPGDPINSLAAAAFLILLYDPRQLFAAGFQLSFAVVLSLALLVPWLNARRDAWLRPDPLRPEQPRGWWRERLHQGARWILTSSAVSLAAWLGSLPLIAIYFHLVSPVALLANLAVVPLSALALMSGLGSLACGAWNETLAVWFNHSGWLWMQLMTQISRSAADLPGAWFPVATPHPLLVAAYYAAFLGLATGWAHSRSRRLSLAGTVALSLGCALLHAHTLAHQWTLTIPALRSGEAMFVRGPNPPRSLLMDTGDAASADATVIPLLQAQGIRHPDTLLLSHGDIRHVGGATLVLEQSTPRTLAVGSSRPRSKAYRDALDLAPSCFTQVRHLQRGDELGPWRVLHPAATDRFTLADDQALVLLGAIHGFTVLVLSDLGSRAQDRLLEREPELRADIVIAGMSPHPGLLGAPLLETVKPRLLILVTSDYPASQMPSPSLRRRLRQWRIPLFIVDEQGGIEVRISPRAATVRTMEGTVQTLGRGE